ncbi:hypothetical protein V0R50_15350 [Pseudomonas sp. 148P]|uniref:Secreted protein n=1 Tax=Pseudomonas ulcerans TaxID=3115852 RepID=A0ABU7HST6_9PSED|nr:MULTISPECIES: hypothetical protein [unclassified Pseudomonas]MEE1920662.1 hypothetical protein [Pseudomonas sp. 147P]MEE1934605.1 hypothetical protein [Pseudomonas sp. 148P]
MRLHSLLALAAAGALLMPLAANAGKFPPGKEGTYMDQCIQAANGQGVDAKTANGHCKCGKEAIEKNFTDKEIAALDSTTGVDAALMQRAQTAVKTACPPKK